MQPTGGTVDAGEVDRFAALAGRWWDPDGPFRPLHRMNPVRLDWLRDHLCGQFGRDPAGRGALEGLRVLDVGCGGGLLSEPLARMGATVTGIDAAEDGIAAARAHAAAGAGAPYAGAIGDRQVRDGRRRPARRGGRGGGHEEGAERTRTVDRVAVAVHDQALPVVQHHRRDRARHGDGGDNVDRVALVALEDHVAERVEQLRLGRHVERRAPRRARRQHQRHGRHAAKRSKPPRADRPRRRAVHPIHRHRHTRLVPHPVSCPRPMGIRGRAG